MNRREILKLTLVAPIATALGTLKPKFIPDPMSDHFHYGIGYKVSREMIEDDLYVSVYRVNTAMMRKMQAKELAQMENNAILRRLDYIHLNYPWPAARSIKLPLV